MKEKERKRKRERERKREEKEGREIERKREREREGREADREREKERLRGASKKSDIPPPHSPKVCSKLKNFFCPLKARYFLPNLNLVLINEKTTLQHILTNALHVGNGS